jgi:hypothetical protein
MAKVEAARSALERIRLAANAGSPAEPQDVEALMAYVQESETAVLGAIDLLARSRDAFRSKQVERARKILEALLSTSTKTDQANFPPDNR